MKLIGLDKVLRSLDFDESKLQNAVREAGALVEQTAVSNITEPILKPMVNSFDVRDGDFIGVNIGTDSEIGAYEEFGTGGFVVIPPETTSEYALRWYINGKGTMNPSPWLFPSWRSNKTKVYQIITESILK